MKVKQHRSKAITITAADILGVADRVGSLQVGKDADIIILEFGADFLTTHPKLHLLKICAHSLPYVGRSDDYLTPGRYDKCHISFCGVGTWQGQTGV